MKKIIFAVTVLAYCLLVTITSKAQESINVPDAVQQSFDSHFKNADFKRWVQIKEAFVATFKADDVWRDAYFTKEGEYKGLGKHITIDLLPVFVQQTLTTNYPGYEISELYQYECMENGLSYFAVLKNDKREITVQLTPFGEVTFSQRNKIKQIQAPTSSMAANH